MLTEDQNTGSDTDTSTEMSTSEATETQATETPTEQTQETSIQHDDTPINPVSDALAAFEAELGRGSANQPPAGNANKPPPTARVLDGLEGEEQEWFKQMRNSAYGGLYPKYTKMKQELAELAKLKQQYEETKDAHLYEHEGAWRLAPEYNELSAKSQQLEIEAQYWQDQLAAVEAGEKWAPLMVDQNGKLFKGEEQESSPAAKARILASLTKASTLQGQISSQLSEFEGGFKNKHKSYLDRMYSMREQVFGKEHLPKLEKMAAKKLDMFPSYVRGKPEVKMLAESLVLIDALIGQIKTLRGSSATTNLKAATAKNAGPTGVSNAGASKGNTVGDVTDQFRRLKAGLPI